MHYMNYAIIQTISVSSILEEISIAPRNEQVLDLRCL